jgi:hypothetical protein
MVSEYHFYDCDLYSASHVCHYTACRMSLMSVELYTDAQSGRSMCCCHVLADLTASSSDNKAQQVGMQKALHDCSAALNVYSVYSSDDTEHQQIASSSDSVKHTPSGASVLVAIQKWLRATTT